MRFNDVLAEGTEPLFFLDYSARFQLDENVRIAGRQQTAILFKVV
jgi:phosphoribosylaminoimidazole (AIR) synthetase